MRIQTWNRDEYVARFGPKDVVGPDGVTVRLTAKPTGSLPGPAELGSPDPLGCLVAIVGMLAVLVARVILFRGGWTLHIKVAGQRKKIKVRLKSMEAAAQRLQEVADRIRLDGLAALPGTDS